MIKWEEFDKIHVVKKIKEVVSDWFKVEIFLLDDQGSIRNMPKNLSTHQFSNLLIKGLLENEKSFELIKNKAVEVNDHLLKNNLRFYESKLFKGISSVSFPIIVDGEYLGAVYAVFYKEKEEAPSSEFQEELKAMGFGDAFIKESHQDLKVVNEKEQNYFRELTDLVAQEIVTLHKEIASRESRIDALNQELGGRYKYQTMIGKSKPMQELYSLLDKIQNSESSVLIQGSNGTGKELIAKAIHYNGMKKDKIFHPINCAAFNDNLLESELFGHMKGSFTGAIRDRKGCFEMANGGTLFMDEIGDISQAMQVKLLRVLQDGTFTPVGGTEQKKSKVRVIAATNRDLKKMVEDGSFRQDLFYRLNVIGIQVPTLKERKEDILLLAEHFLARSAKEKNIPSKILSKTTIEKLYDYVWPGNIRELENEMERVTVLSGDEKFIPPEVLSPRIRDSIERPKMQGTRLSGKLKDALESLERDMIREGLRRCNWNKSRLAKELGISRAGLIMKVEKYGLDKRKLANRELEKKKTGS